MRYLLTGAINEKINPYFLRPFSKLQSKFIYQTLQDPVCHGDDHILLKVHTANKEGKDKGKGIPQQTEVAPGVPGRLRPRIFSTFGTTRVVGRQPNAPATFTPGEIPGTHF